jgi:hypothetical protein
MTAEIHESMHRDHKAWESEFNAWRDDIRMWQEEYAQTRKKYQELETIWQKHEEALRQHASIMRLDELKCGSHEHAIAEFEQGASGADLPRRVALHQGEAKHHEQLRATHEKLKRYHHELIARWRMLIHTLESAHT